MIRAFSERDTDSVMRIWLNNNIKAHSFIEAEYWRKNYEAVKNMLPEAEIYIYEDDKTKKVNGFIGLQDNYIAGIFVEEAEQTKGIGKQLLDYVKNLRAFLSLRVYSENTRAISFYQRERFLVRSEGFDEATNKKELLMTWSK